MATTSEWITGARPRTLGAAIAPVLVGTAAAHLEGSIVWGRAVAALIVALALQVGVNYANDYSDGVRGTDKDRKGPMRLTASELASPDAVRTAAIMAFAVAAGFGLWISLVVDLRLLLLGAVCIAAAVLYTGGPKPLGYLGLGELMVLACFGFAACAGSAYVQHRHVGSAGWLGSLVTGLPAVGVLLANNIRDIPTDRVAGKHTLAVRMGAERAKGAFVAVLVGAWCAALGIGVHHPWVLLALLVAGVLAIGPIRLVIEHSDPPSLVRALVMTVRYQVVLALAVSIALWKS